MVQATTRDTAPTPQDLSPEEVWALFDARAHRYLGVNGKEFIRMWNAGEYKGRDDSSLMRVAILLPFVQ